MGIKGPYNGCMCDYIYSAEFFINLFDVYTIRKGGGVVKEHEKGLCVLNKRPQCKTVHQ